MIPKVPCKNCSERKVGCHSDCKKYLTYKNEMERQRMLRTEQKEEIDFHICEKGRL
ncbi:hypothetical protein [Eubacterium sp.]